MPWSRINFPENHSLCASSHESLPKLWTILAYLLLLQSYYYIECHTAFKTHKLYGQWYIYIYYMSRKKRHPPTKTWPHSNNTCMLLWWSDISWGRYSLPPSSRSHQSINNIGILFFFWKKKESSAGSVVCCCCCGLLLLYFVRATLDFPPAFFGALLLLARTRRRKYLLMLSVSHSFFCPILVCTLSYYYSILRHSHY